MPTGVPLAARRAVRRASRMSRALIVGVLLVELLWLPGGVALAQERERPDVTAAGAVLWDPADDRALFGKDADVGRPMASTTKIMTVLLALEAGAVGESLVVSAEAERVGRIPGGATLGLEAGEVLPVRSVLAGLMLRSGNDGAVAVAEHVAGTEDAFVALMNARAATMGLTATNFVNASGLTDDLAHHASPTDLARLAQVAMTSERFAAWAGSARLAIPGIGTVANRNQLLETFEGATGVKTGYTDLAGLCLVASATRGDRTLYAVVLDSEDSFGDTATLLEHGFSAYDRVSVLRAGDPAGTYRWSHAGVDLVAAEPLARTVPAGAQTRWRTTVDPDVDAPTPAGTVVGAAELLVDDRVVDSAELRTTTEVPAPAPQPPASEIGASVQEALRGFLRLEPVEQGHPSRQLTGTAD